MMSYHFLKKGIKKKIIIKKPSYCEGCKKPVSDEIKLMLLMVLDETYDMSVSNSVVAVEFPGRSLIYAQSL